MSQHQVLEDNVFIDPTPTINITMDYRAHPKADLIIFAKDRGLDVPSSSRKRNGEPTKVDYIKALREADQAATFRFLDLPPEMRNNIYRELLLVPAHDRMFHTSVHPSILATCKQVNKEATDILYGETTIDLKLWNRTIILRHDHVRIGGFLRSDTKEISWPDYLHRARNVGGCHRQVVYGAHEDGAALYHSVAVDSSSSASQIEKTIISLCIFLTGGHDLRSLKLTIHKPDVSGPIRRTITWAVGLLGPSSTSSISHGISEPESALNVTAPLDDEAYSILVRFESDTEVQPYTGSPPERPTPAHRRHPRGLHFVEDEESPGGGRWVPWGARHRCWGRDSEYNDRRC